MKAFKTLLDSRQKFSELGDQADNPKPRKASSTGHREHLARCSARIGQPETCQRQQSHPRPTSQSACLPAWPAWRTAAFAPDGFCREPVPPARPEGYGEKLSISHRNFAASRLRVKSVISARPAPQGRKPTHARAPMREPARAPIRRRATRARTARPTGCGPARIAKLEGRHESLCASFVPSCRCSWPSRLVIIIS
jgi:hypothetical protein